MKKISLSLFKTWLKRHKPRASVGRAWENNNCPISRYTKIDFGLAKHSGVTLPKWANEFMRQVDDAVPVGKSIRREIALRILRGIEKEKKEASE